MLKSWTQWNVFPGCLCAGVRLPPRVSDFVLFCLVGPLLVRAFVWPEDRVSPAGGNKRADSKEKKKI